MVWSDGPGHSLSNYGVVQLNTVMKLDKFGDSKFPNITPKINSKIECVVSPGCFSRAALSRMVHPPKEPWWVPSVQILHSVACVPSCHKSQTLLETS